MWFVVIAVMWFIGAVLWLTNAIVHRDPLYLGVGLLFVILGMLYLRR